MSLTYVGRYQELPQGPEDGPSLHDAAPLEPDTKERVLRYLRTAPVLAATGTVATDVVTGDDIGTLQIHTDGHWVWYADLAHYLETYDSPLPEEFVEVASQGTEPQLSQEELMAAAREMRGF